MNKNTFTKIGIGGIIIGAALMTANYVFAAESALWTSMNVSGKLSNGLTLAVEEEFRFADLAGPELARQHTEFDVAYAATDWLSASLGYRNVSTGEHRPYVGVGLNLGDWGPMSLSNRTRMELRITDGEDWRARTSVTASMTGDGVLGLNPCVNEEVFVNGDGLSENRLSVGVSKSLMDYMDVGVYYMWNASNSDSWTHAHVFGLDLSVSL